MKRELSFKKFFFERVINKKNFTYRILISIIDSYLIKGKRVLDAGCGEGSLSFYMLFNGSKVYGIDKTQKNINKCKKKSSRLKVSRKIHFFRGDILKYKTSKKFSLITSFEVIEHIKNYRGAINNLIDLLETNGFMIISTPSRNAPLYRLGLTKREDRRAGHLRRYSMGELTGLLRDAGLRIVETRRTEGIFRNFLFYNKLGALPLRFANRFTIISDIFTFIDNISLKLFGESQLIVVAQKPGKKKKK